MRRCRLCKRSIEGYPNAARYCKESGCHHTATGIETGKEKYADAQLHAPSPGQAKERPMTLCTARASAFAAVGRISVTGVPTKPIARSVWGTSGSATSKQRVAT